MRDRRIDVFFYGLFMDVDILRDSGVAPANPRHGFVDDLALRIGQRATLIHQRDARAFGMLIALSRAEVERLYAAPGLENYRPEAVLVRTLEGEVAPALCYNLMDELSPEERNPEYASRLQGVLRKLGFPSEYVASIG